MPKRALHWTYSFGLQSLRAGGATSAAVAGIEDSIFKKYDRWSSETARDGYVRENKLTKILFSKHLACNRNPFSCLLFIFKSVILTRRVQSYSIHVLSFIDSILYVRLRLANKNIFFK